MIPQANFIGHADVSSFHYTAREQSLANQNTQVGRFENFGSY